MIIKPQRRKLRYRFNVSTFYGEWFWTLKSRNGGKVAESSSFYRRKSDAVKACEQLQDFCASSAIFVEGKELE